MNAETIESLAVLSEKAGAAIAFLIRGDPECIETEGFARYLEADNRIVQFAVHEDNLGNLAG